MRFEKSSDFGTHYFLGEWLHCLSSKIFGFSLLLVQIYFVEIGWLKEGSKEASDLRGKLSYMGTYAQRF